MKLLLAGGLPLGFDLIELLLHILNFVILLIGIRYLLYKPIKKFMVKRETEYRNAEEKKNQALEETTKQKSEAQKIINEARQKAVHISEEASAAAEIQKQETINSAKEQAKDLLEKAKTEIQHEQTKAKEQMLYSVSELAVDIASRILEREINVKDNDAIINTLIEEWKQEDA